MAWYNFAQGKLHRRHGRRTAHLRQSPRASALGPAQRARARPRHPSQQTAGLSTAFQESYLMPTLVARLAIFFGALAALLVCVGLYGTLAYRVHPPHRRNRRPPCPRRAASSSPLDDPARLPSPPRHRPCRRLASGLVHRALHVHHALRALPTRPVELRRRRHRSHPRLPHRRIHSRAPRCLRRSHAHPAHRMNVRSRKKTTV